MTLLDVSAYQPNIDYEKVKRAGIDGVIPVSYTHLDVYKRQAGF